MYYPDDVVERVRMENDIVSLIGEYVSLSPKGGSMFGLCPFHSENTPSFSVSSLKQLYYCFGCGASGNVISFVMQKENYDFPTAIKALAERARIELPEERYTEAAKKDAKTKKTLIEIHKLSARYYYDKLNSDEGERARKYLDARDIHPKVRVKFGLGYAPGGWDGLCKFLDEQGYKEPILLKTGLIGKNNAGKLYDRFRNRLMFPILDIMGNVIGFGGRIIGEGEPKYLNSPETMIFEKNRNLYSLNFARTLSPKELILVEGYMDVIGLYQAGFKNAVASLGTAFGQNHAKLMKKYAGVAVLAFDGDDAGKRAALRAIPILVENGLRVRVLDLDSTKAKDPDEYITKFGKDKFLQELSNAMSHVAFNIKQMEKEYDIQTDTGKIDFTEAAAKLLSKLPGEIEKDVYISETSKITGISDKAIRAEILKQSRNLVGGTPKLRRNFELSAVDKRRQKGLIEAKKGIILYAAEDKKIALAIREVLNPKELKDYVFVKLLEIIFNTYDEGGNIYPAELVSRFESHEEQREASDIFINTITPEDEKSKFKALSDHVRAVKKAYIEEQLFQIEDDNEALKLIEAKNNLEKLYISL
ncbi:MAG: DNA primase [Defluviitaleaceae bacterium]|nr:DNA primase [Defluviitaleaceae bacterium]